MRRHPHGIPPLQCSATAKSTGKPCEQWAMVGATVCFHHGANGNVKRSAMTKVTLAQLLEADPQRDPWTVLLDMTATLDAITRDCRAQIIDGETVDINALDRLISLAQTTHHMASVAINSKAAENLSIAVERRLELQGELVAVAICTAIDEVGLTPAWRDYALQVGERALLDGEADGDEPQPPDDPIIQQRDVPVRSMRAIEGSRGLAPRPRLTTSSDQRRPWMTRSPHPPATAAARVRASESYNPLPQASAPQRVWLRKFRMMQAGGGMASVIYAPERPRNLDGGDTRAIVRDGFSPWRERRR